MKHRIARSATLAVFALSAMTAFADTQTFQIDPVRSRATIHVGKAGLFSFIAGHTHEVSGPIQSGSVDFDPDTPSRSRVTLTIATSGLKVSAEQEPEGDAPKVQDAMGSDKVLDVDRYPRIRFESTSVTVKHREGNSLDLAVTGQLTIREVTREVTAPVRIELTGNAVTCTGRFTITQSSFGIKPISVGGVVAVKDALDIEFWVIAQR